MAKINKYGEIDEAMCPGCGSPIKPQWVACPECGHDLGGADKKKSNAGSNTHTLYCQVCMDYVTIMGGSSPKLLCPYLKQDGDYVYCQEQSSWGIRRKCGILVGLSL